MRKFLFSLAVVIVLPLLGCDSPEVASVPEPVAQKQVAAKTSPIVSQAANQLLVSIIPEPPTADGCLKALVSGSAQANYIWEVNGIEQTDQTSNTLCEGFRYSDEVTVKVSDGKASGAISVSIANAPPRITEVTINADGIPRHADIVINQEVFDADDDFVELSYQWYINEEADSLLTENILPAKRYLRGDTIRFTITPADGVAEGVVYQSATLTVPNAAPQILSELPEKFEALAYKYQLSAMDPDGDEILYTLEEAPVGMTINSSTGLVTWPLSGVKGGDYPVKIVVSDPDGANASQEYTLTLGVPQ